MFVLTQESSGGTGWDGVSASGSENGYLHAQDLSAGIGVV